jgi:dethiobiotin synthetase
VAVRGCFVTGTDTGAGKTILAAALCAAIRASGARVAAFKPVVTGFAEVPAADGATREAAGREAAGREAAPRDAAPREAAGREAAPRDAAGRDAAGRDAAVREAAPGGGPSGAWPADHELLAAVTGARPGDVTTRTFAPAVSPHLAAALAGTTIGLDELVTAAARAARDADVLVVEGVGGLLVPLGDEHDIRDLAVALGLPLVIATRPGLGTINHSLLTIEAARAKGLDVRAVVLTPWPAEPTVMERSNRDTIASRGAIEVATLAGVGGVDDLASAGARLPWADWLGGVSF